MFVLNCRQMWLRILRSLTIKLSGLEIIKGFGEMKKSGFVS